MPFKSILALAVAALLVFGPGGAAFAKRSGSFSYGGSRSSSSGWSSSTRPAAPSGSSSSSGWSSGSKPMRSTPATPSSPAPSGTSGWSNTGGAFSSQASRSSGGSAFSSAGADAAKRQAATTSYQGYQGLYSKSGNAVNPGQVSTSKPILNQSRTFGSYRDYNAYRDNYYAGRGWSAPGYAFGSYSSFGMWDAMFMWFMLSHLTSGPSFFYNHQNDPGVQAFQQEAQKLSAQNADLKKQLDDLNAKLDSMKKDGVPVDPNAMPKDVDPNVALAQPKIEAPTNAAKSLFWPIVALVAAGGAGYLFLLRRKPA